MASLRLEVRLLSLPLAQRLRTAAEPEPDATRLLTVVRLEDERGAVGWGECAALNRPGYTDEWAEGAYHLLRSAPELDDAGGAAALVPTAPMAMAALEMAEYDLRLTERGIPLARFLGVERTEVPAGAVVPLGTIDDAVRSAERLVRQGYRRIKFKVVPSRRAGFTPARLVAAVRTAVPDIVVHLDANGSFSAADVGEIHELGGMLVEQPFPPEDTQLAGAAVAAGVGVLADESATSLSTIHRLVDREACVGVVVKPPRLGGLFVAFEVLGWCAEQGVPAAAGGLMESSLGRHALAVTAASDACSIVGDLSPAGHWLAADPWPDLTVDGAGMITVPTGPGVAPPPDLEVLAEHTVDKTLRRITLDEH